MTNIETYDGLPAVLPQVHFDMSLGKTLSNIDFDYAKYVKHLETEGLSDEQIAETTVFFGPKDKRVHGSYFDKEIIVNIPDKDPNKIANMSLAHETRHRIDDKDGEFFTLRSLLSVAAIKAGMGLGDMIAGVGAASYVVDNFIFTSPINKIDGKMAVLGTALALGCEVAYWSSKHEIRARKAGRQAVKVVRVRQQRGLNPDNV